MDGEKGAKVGAKRRRVNRKLGPFATVVMQATKEAAKVERYGLAIAALVSKKLGEPCELAQVYVCLHRMVKYGYLEGKDEPHSKTEPRMVRRYTMTEAGVEALERAKAYYALSAGKTTREKSRRTRDGREGTLSRRQSG